MSYAALAITIVLEEAVTHEAFSPHPTATNLACNKAMHDVAVHAEAGPKLNILIPQVVIVAIAVTFNKFLVTVVYVVHCFSRGLLIITYKISIGVMEVLTAQEVLDGSEVRTTIAEQLYTSTELSSGLDVPIVSARQVGHQVIIVASLYPIDSVSTNLVELSIGKVQFVEVDLTICFILPIVVSCPESCIVIVVVAISSPYIIVI